MVTSSAFSTSNWNHGHSAQHNQTKERICNDLNSVITPIFMAHTVVNITDPRAGTGAQKLVTNVKLCLIFYWFKLRNIDVCVNYSLVILTVKQPICRGPKSRIKTPAKWEGALHVTSFSRRLYTSILMFIDFKFGWYCSCVRKHIFFGAYSMPRSVHGQTAKYHCSQ